MQAQKPSVEIEGWAVVTDRNNVGYEELRPGYRLTGKVFGHPRIEPGSFIFSSQIVSVDEARRIVETRNTSYHLGGANREYQTWFCEQCAQSAA